MNNGSYDGVGIDVGSRNETRHAKKHFLIVSCSNMNSSLQPGTTLCMKPHSHLISYVFTAADGLHHRYAKS